MVSRTVREWFIDSVLGKVAIISWGLSHHPPVLLVHGYMDTAATFIPLLEELPDTHFYVGFDFPGHGKSCRLPVGPAPSPAVFVETLRAVVDSLEWEEFVLMGHSMGGVVGFFYNYFYPSKISRMVLLDPLLPLNYYYYLTHEPATWYSFFYDEYYLEFKKNHTQGRLFTYEQAVKLVMSSRDICRKTAEVLLARALVPADGNLFRFSSQLMVKRMGMFPIQEDLLFHTLTTNQPPILSLVALGTKNNILPEVNGFSKKILKVLGSQKNTLVFIEGNHDVHLSTPEELAPFIEDYFNRDEITINNSFTAKL